VEVQSEVRATFFPAPKGFVGTSISADGRFVGGYLFVEGIGRVLARWTVGESSVLEVRPLAANAGVTEVSSEGSFAVGGIPTSAWLMPGGIEFEIGFPGSTRVLAQDISSDGRTVVGAFTSDANERAFKWSNAQGSLRVLQGAAAELNFGQVRISRDGTTIVGLTSVGQDRLAVEHDGIVTVHETGPLLPALAVSDGVNPTVVCTRADDTTAITVTSAGVTTLARPEGHTQSVAWDISADGSLVVGETYPSSGAAVPTFWVNGVPHSQREYLQTSYGFALGETSVFRSISGSGRELYGFHNNQDGVLRLMPR
jgi:probable HAF family extracellular repeat protein